MGGVARLERFERFELIMCWAGSGCARPALVALELLWSRFGPFAASPRVHLS